MNWFDDYIADSVAANLVPPTITIVSPTPGVAPGSPGGFPADWAAARFTPIVLQITDLSPGVLYASVVVRYAGAADELVIYRRGALRGAFAGTSSVSSIANGIQISVLPAGGWPSSDALNDVTFEIDAVDGTGNLAA